MLGSGLPLRAKELEYRGDERVKQTRDGVKGVAIDTDKKYERRQQY